MDIEKEAIENPGSALGEAIGAQLEITLNEYLAEVVSKYQCRLISKGQANKKTKKETKLILFDNAGTQYNIDAVVTNESLQPLILIEYKYIRYKKHNRDKGSWICTAHNSIRRRYNSVRSSIAVLAGSWSGTSLAMMRSNDINIFLIPFEKITALLKEHGIKFDWGEKDRHIAHESWLKFDALSIEQKRKIAEEMIDGIKPTIESAIEKTLDDSTERMVSKVALEVHTNIGEVKRFEFDTIEDALNFLEDFSFEEMLNTKNAYTLLDKPEIPEEDDDDVDEIAPKKRVYRKRNEEGGLFIAE